MLMIGLLILMLGGVEYELVDVVGIVGVVVVIVGVSRISVLVVRLMVVSFFSMIFF